MKNKKEKILFFTSELGMMLKSGVTLVDIIEILLKVEKEKNFKLVLKDIHKNLIAGRSIYDSFKGHVKLFGTTYIYMLKVGELTGTLSERLEDICKNLEFSIENKKKISSMLVYPMVVLVLTISVVSFLLIFILPNFISIFKENNIELPLCTKILLFISKNFHIISLFLIVSLLGLFLLNKYINNNKYYKLKKDKLILKLPSFGNLYKLYLASDIYRSLYILLNVGSTLLESLDTLYTNNNNEYIKNCILDLKKSIASGNTMAESIKRMGLYNERFLVLIISGEESGNLTENLLQISKILKQDFEYEMKRKVALLEPLMTVLLGLVVAFVVVAIYLPILSIGNIFN